MGLSNTPSHQVFSLRADEKIAIVTSRFNASITERLKSGAIERFKHYGVQAHQLKWIEVPGAIEIPITLQVLAQKKEYAALIALGAVIRGETTHYDLVCDQVSQGCQRVALDHHIPIIFEILTTENEAQALARSGGAHSHKGHEAVDAALEMITTLRDIRENTH